MNPELSLSSLVMHSKQSQRQDVAITVTMDVLRYCTMLMIHTRVLYTNTHGYSLDPINDESKIDSKTERGRAQITRPRVLEVVVVVVVAVEKNPDQCPSHP